jgi:hypothetical protein
MVLDSTSTFKVDTIDHSVIYPHILFDYHYLSTEFFYKSQLY